MFQFSCKRMQVVRGDELRVIFYLADKKTNVQRKTGEDDGREEEVNAVNSGGGQWSVSVEIICNSLSLSSYLHLGR